MAESRACDSLTAHTDSNSNLDIEDVNRLLNSYVRFRSIQEVCRANEMDSTDWLDPRNVAMLSSKTKIMRLFTYDNVCDEISKHFNTLTQELRNIETVETNGDDRKATSEDNLTGSNSRFSSEEVEDSDVVSKDVETILQEGQKVTVLDISDEVKVNPLLPRSECNENKDAISGNHGQDESEDNHFTAVGDDHDSQPKHSHLSYNMKDMKDVAVIQSRPSILSAKQEKTEQNLKKNQYKTSRVPVVIDKKVNTDNLEKIMEIGVKVNVPIIDISDLSIIDSNQKEFVKTEERLFPNLRTGETIPLKKRSASDTDFIFAEVFHEKEKMFNLNASFSAIDENPMTMEFNALDEDNKIGKNEGNHQQTEKNINKPCGNFRGNELDNARPAAQITIKKRISKHIRWAFSKTKTMKKYFKF